MKNTTKSQSQAPLCQSSTCQGPVAILWDMENCPVPTDVRAEDVAGNIRMALHAHSVIDGAVAMFSAYGDFNGFPRRIRVGCQRTGVKLIDVPNGRKDAADKAILVDMFLFSLDNRPPSSIMLISGDVDFAPALHILGQRGYTIILAVPSSVWVSPALTNAGRLVWDWQKVVRGEHFPARTLVPSRPCLSEISRHFMGCPVNNIMDDENEEESIVYEGISRSSYSTDCPVVSQSLSDNSNNSMLILQYPTFLKSNSPLFALKDVPSRTFTSYQNDRTLAQPGDLHGLKVQLVNLLVLVGGKISLNKLTDEYFKLYGRVLCVSSYGASKLRKLVKQMPDAIAVQGKGQKKVVCLTNTKSQPISSPAIVPRRGKQEYGIDVTAAVGSSDEFSDDEKEIMGSCNSKKDGDDSDPITVDRSLTFRQNLDKFKYELQEILVSYSFRIFLGCFEAIYQQRYKHELDYATFGVNKLDELLERVKDVAVVQEDPVSKTKFLVIVGD